MHRSQAWNVYPGKTASEMRNTYVSMHEIQWLFMDVFNYYILQLRSERAPSAFDKASYFTLACVSVKWERVRLIDRGSVEMMHFPCDCFHSHYSQHRVISRPLADTSACACTIPLSHRRVRLPLPQRWSLIARLNQWAKIMDYVHSYQSSLLCEGSHEGHTAAGLFMKEARGLLEISLTFCLLDVIVLPVKSILGGMCLCCPWLESAQIKRERSSDKVLAWPLDEVTSTDTSLLQRFMQLELSLYQKIKLEQMTFNTHSILFEVMRLQPLYPVGLTVFIHGASAMLYSNQKCLHTSENFWCHY